MVCAEFVLGKWRIKARFPELQKAAGNTMTDPISDMLIRIKNAQMAGKKSTEIPYSNLKSEIAQVLLRAGLLEKVEVKGRKTNKAIEVGLVYKDGVPVISNLKRISKPGQRIYLDYDKIHKVRGGYGIAIVSTSKGLLTNKEAAKQKVGGEILCEVW